MAAVVGCAKRPDEKRSLPETKASGYRPLTSEYRPFSERKSWGYVLAPGYCVAVLKIWVGDGVEGRGGEGRGARGQKGRRPTRADWTGLGVLLTGIPDEQLMPAPLTTNTLRAFTTRTLTSERVRRPENSAGSVDARRWERGRWVMGMMGGATGLGPKGMGEMW